MPLNKFAVFSDLHLHQWAYGSRLINGRNSRLEQQKKVCKQIASYCKEHEIETIFFCGDFFHTSHVTAECATAAAEIKEVFAHNNILLYLIAGNHDYGDKEGTLHALAPLRGELTQVIGFDLGSTNQQDNIEICDGCRVGFLPFVSERRRLEEELKKLNGVDFLFLHQGVSGVPINSKGFTLNEILTPDDISSTVRMAFSGHYHSLTRVSDNLVIPGSTVQLNWGDEGEIRGFIVYENGELTVVESEASRFITISDSQLVSENTPDLHNHFVRVISSGQHKPEDLIEAVHKLGAESVEVKTERSITPVKMNTTKFMSFNEIVYSFAKTKEQLGIISEYDREIGERILRGNYVLPQV